MSHRYSSGFLIAYVWVNVITDKDASKYYYDDTDSKYDPVEDASNTSYPPPYTPDDNSADNDPISDLDDYNTAIILNPSGVDHYGPIAVVETNHDNIHDNEEPPEA